ncbi:diguanylate cyclase [Azotobacter vinelandii]|uniref:diguanylate cyclase n=1 Tax=Azotobacter vinelandii TaxID=354 RepID=UPI000774787D|nr:diguanylate cyclase [Azotobacter vinelandii]
MSDIVDPSCGSATRQTVLIVDDLPVNLAFVAGVLEAECEVIAASDGTSALRLAVEALPDLILLDVRMPGIGGFEVCRRLKASALTAPIPVIFLTSLSDPDDEAEGLEIGAIDYIVKPFNAPVLRARVRNHLRLARQHELLERMAQCDGLTGIANRRAFDAFLERQWRHQERLRRPLAVLMMDVDHFKAYNDALGHLDGDRCLRQIARAVADARLRGPGLVARFGGEEFACVLPDIDAGAALHVGERMREAVEALRIPHPASSAAPRVTLSIGGATAIPGPGLDAGALLEMADEALYAAKRAGRDRVVIRT